MTLPGLSPFPKASTFFLKREKEIQHETTAKRDSTETPSQIVLPTSDVATLLYQNPTKINTTIIDKVKPSNFILFLTPLPGLKYLISHLKKPSLASTRFK